MLIRNAKTALFPARVEWGERQGGRGRALGGERRRGKQGLPEAEGGVRSPQGARRNLGWAVAHKEESA